MNLSSLVEALREQRRSFLLFFGAVFGTALVGSLLVTPTYEAVAVIQLMPRAGREMKVTEVLEDNNTGYLEVRDRARTQMQIIASRSIREEVVRRYNALGFADIDLTPKALDRLGRSMSVAPVEDTQLVEIAVLHPNPARAATLANLYAEVYADENLATRTETARAARVWLDGQAESARAALTEASAKVLAFKTEHDLADIDEQDDGVSTRMAALQASLGETTTRRVLLESKLKEHQRLYEQGKTDTLAGLFADPALETMAKEQATRVAQTAEVLARYGKDHPEHQRAVEQRKRVQGLIAVEVRRNIDGERSQLETLVRQEEDIRRELAQVEAELVERQRLKGQYAELKQEEDRARRLYGEIGDRGAEVDLQADSRLSDVRIIDRAQPPTSPVSPNIPVNLGIAVLIGLAGGLAVARVRHGLDDTIRSTLEVEQVLETRLLGAIPTLPRLAGAPERALYTFEHPRSYPAEALRCFRALVQTTAVNGERQRLIITSCAKGEGKTHTAIGLAVAFAQLGTNVLLIDGDLRLPQVHTLLGVPRVPGLSDALVDIEDPRQFVRRTKVPRLHVLTSGNPTDFPNELLASPQLERLLVQLGRAYPVILIDTPPAGVVSDAIALAPKTDGVILVVRQGRVSRSVVTDTLGQLRRMGAQVLGVAVNDVVPPKSAASPYHDASVRTDQAAAP